jgi:hypothetical protein
MKKPLYAISQEYMQAYHALFSDEELPEEVIRDTLAGIQSEFEVKALNVAALIKNMQADANAMKDAESSIYDRRKRLERRIENLERYLLLNIQGAGLEGKPIESPEHYIAIKKCPASVQIEAGAVIPDEYMRIVPQKKEPDKNLLKEAITNKKEIKGVSLIQNTKLVIK